MRTMKCTGLLVLLGASCGPSTENGNPPEQEGVESVSGPGPR